MKALTENGDEVILNKNKTWAYIDKTITEETVIPLNADTFEKADSQTFLLKSKVNSSGIWLNPKAWNFSKAIDNPDAEFEFSSKSSEIYAMIINEKLELPLEVLKTIALESAQSAAPDLKLINEEYRMVNGHKVMHLEMHGTMSGIKFAYFSYYFSNVKGTTQFVVFSSQKFLSENKESAEQFLNGFTVVEE